MSLVSLMSDIASLTWSRELSHEQKAGHRCSSYKQNHLTDHKLSVVAKELGLGEVDISSTKSGGQHSAAGEDNIES